MSEKCTWIEQQVETSHVMNQSGITDACRPIGSSYMRKCTQNFKQHESQRGKKYAKHEVQLESKFTQYTIS